MKRRPVSSTTIAAVGYDERRKILEIEFTSGAVYRYSDVSRAVYAGLMSADSHGLFFNLHVKGNYHHIRLE